MRGEESLKPATVGGSIVFNQKSIAYQAEVSEATVCRVLKGGIGVSAKMRQKVQQAMYDLGLGVQPKCQVALIIPDASNPYFNDISYHLNQELLKRNGVLWVVSSDKRMELELQTIDRVQSLSISRGRGLDGAIYIPALDGAEGILQLTRKPNFPVVVLDRTISIADVDMVTSVFAETLLQAVQALIERGHRRIGCLTGPHLTSTGLGRLKAFEHAIAATNLKEQGKFRFEGDYSPLSGRMCAEVWLALPANERPTAMVCGNDMMAIALMQRVQEAGLRVPDSLSVIGFDDIDWAQWCYPSLTTISQNTKELAIAALDLILHKLDKNEAPENPPKSKTVEVPTRLVMRSSIGRAPL